MWPFSYVHSLTHTAVPPVFNEQTLQLCRVSCCVVASKAEYGPVGGKEVLMCLHVMFQPSGRALLAVPESGLKAKGDLAFTVSAPQLSENHKLK